MKVSEKNQQSAESLTSPLSTVYWAVNVLRGCVSVCGWRFSSACVCAFCEASLMCVWLHSPICANKLLTDISTGVKARISGHKITVSWTNTCFCLLYRHKILIHWFFLEVVYIWFRSMTITMAKCWSSRPISKSFVVPTCFFFCLLTHSHLSNAQLSNLCDEMFYWQLTYWLWGQTLLPVP